jgi:hypothetical protein
MFVCCEYCVLSVQGLCEEMITRPEAPYGLWGSIVGDLKPTIMRSLWPALGRRATGGRGGKTIYCQYIQVLEYLSTRSLFPYTTDYLHYALAV